MKTIRSIYSNIWEYENLFKAFGKAAKGKKWNLFIMFHPKLTFPQKI